MKNSGSSKNTAESRRQYVEAFTGTMIDIWRERLVILKAIHTGALYKSIVSGVPVMNNDVSVVSLSFSFLSYGIHLQNGVGREVYIGNPGDIGRAKVRKKKPWFQPKFQASIYNIRDFMLASFNAQVVEIVDEVLVDRALDKLDELRKDVARNPSEFFNK